MKKVWTKVPAMIGIAISLLSILSLIAMFLYLLFPSLLDDGTSFYDPSFYAWQCSISVIIYSVFSMVFYAVDAILSAIKAGMKIDKNFNIVLTSIIIIGIFIGTWVITSYLRTYKTVIWFSYYFLILFVFEIISIVRCIKQSPQKNKMKEFIY